MSPPNTPAIRALKKAGLPFELHEYKYQPRGGAKAAAQALAVPERQVVKTLIFEIDGAGPVAALMPGDRRVSLKKLARAAGAKSARPAEPQKAEKYSGYRVGGLSPFGLKKDMPIYIEREIDDLETIYLNAGQRGWLAALRRSSGWLSALAGQLADLKQGD